MLELAIIVVLKFPKGEIRIRRARSQHAVYHFSYLIVCGFIECYHPHLRHSDRYKHVEGHSTGLSTEHDSEVDKLAVREMWNANGCMTAPAPTLCTKNQDRRSNDPADCSER